MMLLLIEAALVSRYTCLKPQCERWRNANLCVRFKSITFITRLRRVASEA